MYAISVLCDAGVSGSSLSVKNDLGGQAGVPS